MSTEMPETVAVMPETVTVRPETVVLKPGRHSHGSNFGRYVEGCPQCAKKWPDGPPQRAPRRTKAMKREHAPSPVVEMTREEMIRKLQAQGFRIADGSSETAVQAAEASFAPALDVNMLTEAMRALGTELRRADPEVEEEKRAKKIREQLAKEAERETIRLATEQTKARQAYCRSFGHRQDEGRSTNSAVSGQFCTGDQMFHWICVVCQETGVRKPHPSEMTMGVA